MLAIGICFKSCVQKRTLLLGNIPFKRHSAKKIIYISSGGAIYGEAEEYPTSEGYLPKPLSVYAINKKAGEDYLYYYRELFELDYTVLRYANVYGPRQVSHGEAGVVSIFVEKLLAGIAPSLNAYPDAPQGMIRDYVFVRDVVSANLLAISQGSGEAFNIGSGKETTTRMLYDEICRQLNINIQPIPALHRPGDLRRSLLNSAKAKRILGWQPQYSLAEGISEVISFFKEKGRAQ